jgi:hypothetical protein
MIAQVTIELGWGPDGRIERVNWLVFGQANLRPSRDRPDGRWRLDARMTGGVTDFEHDSAYALKLPLIGVVFENVDYHASVFTGWVDPNINVDDSSEFRVPRQGYDPTKLPDAHMCKTGECKKNPHIIVPEGFWLPPFDLELYRAVRGKKVEIRISPVYPKK